MRRFVILSLLIVAACGRNAPEEVLSPQERMARPADPANGERLARICRTCHEVAEGTGHRVGPNLWNVVGAPAARHPDFAYSQAMTRSGIVWDEAALDAYLANPQAAVPGNRMAFAGIPSAADRRDVIAYLQTLR